MLSRLALIFAISSSVHAVSAQNNTRSENILSGLNPIILKALQSDMSKYLDTGRNMNSLLTVLETVMGNNNGTSVGENSNLQDILNSLFSGLQGGSLLQNLPNILSAILPPGNDISKSLSSLYSNWNSTGIASLLGEILPLLGIQSSGGSNGIVSTLAAMLGARAVDDLKNINVSESCVNDTAAVFAALMGSNLWAFKFIDAMGKPLAGTLEGGIQWLGSFHECLSIKSNPQDVNGKIIGGNYCLLKIPVPASLFSQMKSGNGEVNGLFAGVMNMAATLTYGLCVPDSCSTDDVFKIVNLGLLPKLPESFYGSALPTVQTVCHKEDNVWEDQRATIVIGVLLGIGLLILIGTLYDIVNKLSDIYDKSCSQNDKKKSKPSEYVELSVAQNVITKSNGAMNSGFVTNEAPPVPVVDTPSVENGVKENGIPAEATANGPILTEATQTRHRSSARCLLQEIVGAPLMAFSLYANVTKLVNTDTNAGNLSSVNGVRFLSMSWVVLGHTYFFHLPMQSNLAGYGPEFVSRWTAQVILNALVSVDSFFTLSGLLVAYLTLREMGKRKSAKINWFMFYFHRFWRLTPPYMLILMTYVPLAHYWGSGPTWPEGQMEPETCNTNWWWNLLYINNFNFTKSCMGWTWYLANDMQFYVITPLILVPLYYSKIAGLTILALLFLANFISTGVLVSVNNITMSNPGPDYMDMIYVKPWCRIGPYLVGLLVGYILYKTKCKVKLHWSTVVLGWCGAAVCSLASLYGLYGDSNGSMLSVGASASYLALHRTAWGVGLGWVIFACCNGYGGVVNTFLSWKLFVPLARLTYCTYLVHPIVMYYISYSSKIPFYLSDVTISYLFVGNLVFSYAVALILSVVFEAPMLGLERVIFRRK